MIDINELRGIIAKRGYSQRDVADLLNIVPQTFYRKMKIGIFGSDEISKMIDILDIKNPADVFFAKEVT